MKRLLVLMMAAGLFTGVHATTVLIDYDDGIADNGMHDASIANGGFEDTAYADGTDLAWCQDATNSAGDIPGFYYSYFPEASATDATPEQFLWDASGINDSHRTAVNGWSGTDPVDKRHLMIIPDGWTIADGDTFHIEFNAKEGGAWDDPDTLYLKYYVVDKSSGYTETYLTGYDVVIDVPNNGTFGTFSADLTIDTDTMGAIAGKQIAFRLQGSGEKGEYCILDNFYLTATAIPEPATLVLLGLGSLLLGKRR
jgi:hypothetical protein